jgi:hypothetical protein
VNAADVVLVVTPGPVEPAVPWVVGFLAGAGLLLVSCVVGVAVFLLAGNVQRRLDRRRPPRPIAPHTPAPQMPAVNELPADRRARQRAYPIVPDVAGPLPRAQAWRDVAALSTYEGDFS